VDVLDLAVVATMGSTSNKRAVKNMQTVRYHGFAILLINAIFVAWRLYWNRGTATWGLYASLLPTSVAYGISYRLVMQHAEDGSELFQKGLVEYCWDIIWVTMVTQLLACVTDWAWALYSLVRLCSGSPARRLCKYLEYVRPLTGLHMAQALREHENTRIKGPLQSTRIPSHHSSSPVARRLRLRLRPRLYHRLRLRLYYHHLTTTAPLPPLRPHHCASTTTAPAPRSTRAGAGGLWKFSRAHFLASRAPSPCCPAASDHRRMLWRLHAVDASRVPVGQQSRGGRPR